MPKLTVQSRVSKMMAGITPSLEGMDEAHRELAEDMLKTFCWFSVHLDDLQKKVDKEGPVVETQKGPRENPAIGTIHKLSQRTSDYYTKLMRSLPDEGKEAVDAMTEFLRTGQ